MRKVSKRAAIIIIVFFIIHRCIAPPASSLGVGKPAGQTVSGPTETVFAEPVVVSVSGRDT